MEAQKTINSLETILDNKDLIKINRSLRSIKKKKTKKLRPKNQ